MHDERVYAERSFRAGAHGYIMKEEPWERVLSAVRQVLSGQLAFSSSVTGTLLSRHRSDATGVASLSDRELEVFDLFGRGVRTREVAERLNLSPKTVESHVASIKRKLSIKHTNEMVYRATLWRSHQPRAS